MRLVCPTLLLGCLSLPPAAVAQPPAVPSEPPPRWERKGEISLVATGGNTDTQTLGLGSTIIWRPGTWTTEGRLAFVRSETADVLTAKSLVAELREARALTERLDVFGRFGYLSNEFAGIDRRASIDGGIGYKPLLGPVHALRVDAGLGYAHESRTISPDLSTPLANFGAAYKWQLSKTADFTNAALLGASLDDGSDWRFGNALAVTSALTNLLSLKLSHELKYVNAPVVGFAKTDTLLSFALVATF
jgi:putative salt-induced outer membrane protein YdiY